MRVNTKIIEGIKVTAYNDSNIEWVVQAGDMSEQRFNKRKWSMKESMEFTARMATKSKEKEKLIDRLKYLNHCAQNNIKASHCIKELTATNNPSIISLLDKFTDIQNAFYDAKETMSMHDKGEDTEFDPFKMKLEADALCEVFIDTVDEVISELP